MIHWLTMWFGFATSVIEQSKADDPLREETTMAMSKKDFIALGDAVRDIRGLLERGVFNATREPNREIKVPFAMEQVEQVLADFCHNQNPRFMRERWLGYIAGENGPNGGNSRTRR